MTGERELDDALQRALDTGTNPSETPPEIGPLLEAARELRSATAAADAESGAKMPLARARFERFIDAQAEAARPPARSAIPRRAGRRPWLLTFAGVAAAIALLALIGSRVLFQEADTASAQVLAPGDYAQVDGTVSAPFDASRGSLTLDSAAGSLAVEIPADADIAGPAGAAAAADIPLGAHLAVAGDVGDNGHITARTLAFGPPAGGPPSRGPAARLLQKLDAALPGTVLAVALPRDGSGARVLVQDEGGNRYVVRVDAVSAERLLRLARVLGSRVVVTNPAASSDFTLDVTGGATPPSNAAPAVRTVTGVVTARDANVLTLASDDGEIFVVVRPATRILLSASGLPRDSFNRGERTVIGHGVTVIGSLQRVTGRIVADVIVIGPRQDR